MQKSRKTIQNSLVLQAVRDLTNHPTAEEIYEFIKENHPTISKGTVYRNLGILSELGEIKKVECPNAPDRYDFELKGHYHFKCEICGKIEDSAMEYKDIEFFKRFNEKSNFIVNDYDLMLKGECYKCNEQKQKNKTEE